MATREIPDISSLGKIRKILIVRLFALGDIVLSLPIVAALRNGFPDAWIGYLCRERFAEALGGNTGLDEVLPMSSGISGQLAMMLRLRGSGIDLAIDLLSSPRSALITGLSGADLRIGMDVGRHNWCYDHVLPRTLERDGKRIKCYSLDANREIAGMLGLTDESERRRGLEIGFPAAETEKDWAASYLKQQGSSVGLVGMVAGSNYRSKSWPMDRFVELAVKLRDQLGLRTVLLWGPGESETARGIASRVEGSILPPGMGIARLGALISRLDILIGVDSGPKHLAVVQGIPTVTLFGPTDPEIWDPMTSRHRAIRHRLDCSAGCRQRDCDPNVCMEKITVDEVFSAARSLLENNEVANG
jgi:ADP-heptose:LPS heptosyltransferase